MRIGIFYDVLVGKGGAERVTILLANKLKGDLITAGFNADLNEGIDKKINVINLNNFLINYSDSLGFTIESPLRFFFNRNKFNYDISIYSGVSSIFGSRKGSENIWFCHTPNRILYDLKEIRLNNSNFIKKLFYKIYIKLFYKRDQRLVKENFRLIIANSKNVQNRIKRYYNKDSIVIYPPIDTKKFKFNKFGEFYLAVSRLIPEKRLNLIAQAFTKMPDKKLIFVGDGPEKKKILRIIKDKPNIKLLTDINDRRLIQLYANCLATIYIPIDEDFGIVPLEGMASGKPCIAVNEGGCKETIINGKTGLLIKPDERSIIEAVRKMNVNLARKMKNSCITQAKRFDIKECIKQWRDVIKQNETTNKTKAKS